jgi:hypothetical protein
VVRYYDHGFVALTTTEKGGVFDLSSSHVPPETREVWDVYERHFIRASRERCHMEIQPAVYPASGSTYPSGRVYLYGRG